MYKIIHNDFMRGGLHFVYDDAVDFARPRHRDAERQCGMDTGAQEFQTIEDALECVRQMIEDGERAPEIRIVEVIPYGVATVPMMRVTQCKEQATPQYPGDPDAEVVSERFEI